MKPALGLVLLLFATGQFVNGRADEIELGKTRAQDALNDTSLFAPPLRIAAEIRKANGKWLLDYRFDEPVMAAVFPWQLNDNRQESWRALDSGIVLEKVDGLDVISSETPRETFRFEIQPQPVRDSSLPTPFLNFSDGGVAVFSGQFELLPLAGRDAARELQGDVGRWAGYQPRLDITVNADTQILVNRKASNGTASFSSFGKSSYIYVGPFELIQRLNYVAIVDPGFPDWVKDTVDADLDRHFSVFREFWGTGISERATVLLALDEFDDDHYRHSGKAFPALLTLRMGGVKLKRPTREIRINYHRLLAHEIAHLYQFRTGIGAARLDQRWIHEGAADAMATIALEKLGLITDDEIAINDRRIYDACVRNLEIGALQGVGHRTNVTGHYLCGELIARMTASALSQRTLFDFWNALLWAADERQPANLDTDVYFATMSRLGGNSDTIGAIRSLTEDYSERPEAVLKFAMRMSGLKPEFDADGTLRRLSDEQSSSETTARP